MQRDGREAFREDGLALNASDSSGAAAAVEPASGAAAGSVVEPASGAAAGMLGGSSLGLDLTALESTRAELQQVKTELAAEVKRREAVSKESTWGLFLRAVLAISKGRLVTQCVGVGGAENRNPRS